jgi:hypothetical protein
MANQLSASNRIITEPDTDASQVETWTITGAAWVSIGATCSTAGGSITFRVVFTDVAGNLTGVSPSYTLTTTSTLADWGPVWLGTPTPDTPLPTVNTCADFMRLKADAVTGTWTVSSQSFMPPPAAA